MAFTDEQLVSMIRNPEAPTSTVMLAKELRELRADPRDDFHTMTELYNQRMLWHALAARFLDEGYSGLVSKSWKHHDGEPCFGKTAAGQRWFIVTMHLPDDGGQVTQHYPERDWELFNIEDTPVAPHWDGHTPDEGNQRLTNFLLRP
jgi:hypothetical protein